MASASIVLGFREGDELVGTVLVGNDGHRGWVCYLVVCLARRREGNGRLLMAAVEEWLRESGVVRVQLMVRDENAPMLGFYAAAGCERNHVQVLSRWL